MSGREDVCRSFTVIEILFTNLLYKKIIVTCILNNKSNIKCFLQMWTCRRNTSTIFMINDRGKRLFYNESTKYPAINFKKLRICCIANFGSINDILFSHIKCCGETGDTMTTHVPIIKQHKINCKFICNFFQ